MLEDLLRYIVGGLLLGAAVFAATKADARPDGDKPSYTFEYRRDGLKITVQAENRCAGYKIAAKLCYKALTKGIYPGEEEGMDIIDICANPTNYNP